MNSAREHRYAARVVWTGDRGHGTGAYDSYGREAEGTIAGRAVIPPPLPLSSDPAFLGDGSRHNPEDLLLLSLSSCHMLWYLHLASANGIVVTSYVDEPVGGMIEEGMRGGAFSEVVLHPRVAISSGDHDLALALHERAHEVCYIARSVNFPVRCEATIEVADAGA